MQNRVSTLRVNEFIVLIFLSRLMLITVVRSYPELNDGLADFFTACYKLNLS